MVWLAWRSIARRAMYLVPPEVVAPLAEPSGLYFPPRTGTASVVEVVPVAMGQLSVQMPSEKAGILASGKLPAPWEFQNAVGPYEPPMEAGFRMPSQEEAFCLVARSSPAGASPRETSSITISHPLRV